MLEKHEVTHGCGAGMEGQGMEGDSKLVSKRTQRKRPRRAAVWMGGLVGKAQGE